jgi:F-type H+-transporting ATPase subunit b
MLIDWFTVGAQLLNFLILVWLLKRFLYKPIRNAIDAREQRIAAQLADADAHKAAAHKEQEEFQSRNAAFDAERNAMLAKVAAEAAMLRERLLGEARQAADDWSAKQARSLHDDRVRLGQEVTHVVRSEVFAIVRRVLGDLAAVGLEERIGEVFMRRLRDMDAKAKQALGAAIQASSEPVLVRSTFSMPPERQAAVQNALNEAFCAAIRIRFQTAPESISGIEIVAGGQKLAWSIDDYLNSLEERVGQLLDARANPEVRSETQPASSPAIAPEAEPHATAA